MKKTRVASAGIAFVLANTFLLHAQTATLQSMQPAPADSVVTVAADMQGLTLMAPADLPVRGGGTFWWVMPGGTAVPTPCPPQDLSAAIYQIANGQFLVDQTGGQVALNLGRAGPQVASGRVNAVLEAQANAVENLISQVNQRMNAMGMEPPGFDGMGGTNDYQSSFTPQVFTTNDLWLQMAGVTNHTASLVIHPPWNMTTNNVWDLLYCTNLAPPSKWQWLLRSDPGQTNLTVPNASDAQGFYRLGPPNDLVANDSLGTNFWIACPDTYYALNLSVYISSSMGSTGTVTFPGVLINGPLLTLTNCGDANVNGTYLLDAADGYYVKGTLLVVYDYYGTWYLLDYDSGSDTYAYLYCTGNLNVGDWQPLDDTNLPPPMSSCAQVPLTEPFWLAPGQVTNVTVPLNQMQTDVIETNSIHITASQPVSVFGMNFDSCVSFAFTAYPVPLLGTNYCVLARPSHLDGPLSELAIVATADNTTVWITPSLTANLAGHSAPYSTNLQQGQTYQITGSGGEDDVTGTIVTSDKPIAVFAGASLAFVPDGDTQTGNPLIQEQLPVNTWGRQALGLSFAGRAGGDSYRVLAARNNTVVLTNGVVAGTNQAGEFLDLLIGGTVEFKGSQPIQVAQFANGWQFDADSNLKPYRHEGDPCEILLPPTGHYLETNTVATPVYGFDENYLNLIVAQSAITNTLVDGSIVAATNFVAIGTSGFYGARLTVTTGVHTIISSQPVGVEVYGFGDADAYGYFGGVVK